jgi:hypothetical protein
MASIQPTGSVGFLGTPGITSGPDLETIFMALGFERTQLMDGVVKGSMEARSPPISSPAPIGASRSGW